MSSSRGKEQERRRREEGEGLGVWLQSHEGDVSTCHIVVITCAAVAARLVVVAVVGRGGAWDDGGGRERGGCRELARKRETINNIRVRLRFKETSLVQGLGNVTKSLNSHVRISQTVRKHEWGICTLTDKLSLKRIML